VGPSIPTVDLRASNFDFGDRQLVTKFYEKSSSSYAPWEPDPQTMKKLDMTTSHLPFVETGRRNRRQVGLIMLGVVCIVCLFCSLTDIRNIRSPISCNLKTDL